MKRTDSLPTKDMRNFLHKALRALGFVDLDLLFNRHRPAPDAPAILPRLPVEALMALHAVRHPLGQEPPSHLHIPTEDWDIMFRAIQLRLREAVGERPKSAPTPQADDTAGHIQVVVLECVSAMEQLEAALRHQRT